MKTTKNNVFVREIRPTSSNETMNVVLEQEKEQSAISNFGVFMAGHSKVKEPGKNVAFQMMSVAMIQEKGIVEGCNLSEAIGIDCGLRVTESLTPRQWVKDGITQTQSPKTKGKDGPVMTQNGNPIYRDCIIEIGEKALLDDVLLEADAEVALPIITTPSVITESIGR